MTTSTQGQPFDLWQGLKEVSRFFAGRGEVHQTMRRLARLLEKADIPYAVIGGMAVNAHRFHQTTNDVNVLLNAAGFSDFRSRFVPDRFTPTLKRFQRFTDRKNGIEVSFHVTGSYPGGGRPGPVAFPEPAEVAEVLGSVSVANLTTLIQLKLAAGRFRDTADVINLIRYNNLEEPFAGRLHPFFQARFLFCLEELQRELENEVRLGWYDPAKLKRKMTP